MRLRDQNLVLHFLHQTKSPSKKFSAAQNAINNQTDCGREMYKLLRVQKSRLQYRKPRMKSNQAPNILVTTSYML